ncbi:MAG: peptidylprolyl isomerase [Verrucomicrobia bacterium]|nr:MAG: peptidylprolyl isomerase [Verrucomicrobiota bacterium]
MVRPLVSVLAAAALLSVSPLCRGALAAEAEVIDGIAAVVKLNEASSADVITYSEVRDVSAPKEKLLRDQYRGEELVTKIKEARAEALKDLIDRQLIVQAFKKEGYQIPDHYLDQRVQDIIRENFNGDRNTFIKTLQAQTFTLGEFRKLETEKMIVQAMRHKNVEVNTIISPNKIQDYYRKHAAEFTSKEQVKLRMIMISAGTSDRAGQKAMAEEVLSKLVNGAEFDRMAQIYSEDSTRDLGGDWGWIDRGTLTAPLEKVAFSLRIGKISNIVEVGGNYYILKVEGRQGGVTRPFAEVRDEIEKKLTSEEAQAMQERWLASLRQKAYIKMY